MFRGNYPGNFYKRNYFYICTLQGNLIAMYKQSCLNSTLNSQNRVNTKNGITHKKAELKEFDGVYDIFPFANKLFVFDY